MNEVTKRYRYLGAAGYLQGVGHVSAGALLPADLPPRVLAGLLAYGQAEEIAPPLVGRRVRAKDNPDASEE